MLSVRSYPVLAPVLLLCALSLAAEPQVTVDSSGLRASGITAGGEAIWFGENIDSYAGIRRLTRHVKAVRDDDGDGTVSYEIPALSRFSVFVVVDAATAQYAVYKGSGVDGLELDVPGNAWRPGVEHVDFGAALAEILLVRPREGAWTLRAVEGGKTDGDRALNGKLRFKPNEMQPLIAGGRPPGGVRPGDLLVLINPQSLAYVIRPAKD